MLKSTKSRRRKCQQIAFVGSVAITCLLLFLQEAYAQGLAPETASQSTYLLYCASCHGRTGEGEGPMSAFLTRPPANLTLLAKRNRGFFPYESLEEIIDGRKEIASHGIREMPIWGTQFRRAAEASSNPLPREIQVNQKIRGLVDYIASIQSE